MWSRFEELAIRHLLLPLAEVDTKGILKADIEVKVWSEKYPA